MFRHSFVLKNYEDWLTGFAESLKVKTTHKNFLQLPPQLGDGYIYAKNISPDITFNVMNFTLNDDLVLAREKNDLKGYYISFNKVDLGGYAKLHTQHNTVTDSGGKKNVVFITDPSSYIEVGFPSGTVVKRLGVFYSNDIVQNHLPKEVIDLMNVYVQRKIKSVDDMLLSIKYNHLLNEIFSCDWVNPACSISNYIKIFQLTEIALHAFFAKPEDMFRHVKTEDIKALQMIEENITQPGLLSFPSISNLAKKACMSPSKLKTLFKNVYGYSLYAYFNKNRMIRAKELMKDRNLTIKEVGYDIGYSNLSQFTAAFKKEFGLTPKEFQKQLFKL